jgi:hypothetical protein
MQNIVWHIDPLLRNYLETNNETMVIVMQELRKYATVLKSLLGRGPLATMVVLLEAVFSMWSAPRLFHSTDRVDLVTPVWTLGRIPPPQPCES